MNISSKIAGWCLSFLLVAPASLQAQEKNPQGLEKSCHNFVQQFYEWYVRKNANFDLALKHYAFSLELRRQLKAVGGELDFDPFVTGQDRSSAGYAVGKVRRKNDRYLADVYCLGGCVGDGTNKKALVVVPELIYKGGRWSFVNFHYGKSEYPVNENLLSILKHYRKNQRLRSH